MPTFGKQNRKAGVERPAPPKAAQTVPREHRRAPRKTTRSLAQLVCARTGQELECIVQDISATGAKARLQGRTRQPFAPAVQIPAEFRLIIPNDGIEIDCRLAWTDDATFGIAFLSGFRPARPGRPAAD